MTKPELINSLQHVYGNLLLGNILLGFSDSINWKLVGTTIHEVRSPSLTFSQDLRPVFGTTISLKRDQSVMVEEFQKMLRRSAVAESFEAISFYCHQSDQVDKLKAEDWFEFAKILRNTTSHKQGDQMKWPRELAKKNVTSVGWRHRKLDANMEGQSIQFFDAEALLLMKDELEFVENSLT